MCGGMWWSIHKCVPSVEDGGGAGVCGCELAIAGMCVLCVCTYANQEKGRMKTSQQKQKMTGVPCVYEWT